MKDWVFGDLLFISPFMLPLMVGIAGWLMLRGLYAPTLYSGLLWYPNIIDIGVLFLSIYTCHLLLLYFEG